MQIDSGLYNQAGFGLGFHGGRVCSQSDWGEGGRARNLKGFSVESVCRS
jgi:hypothetical protein